MNILITYTTVSGNTEIVCQTVKENLEAKNFDVTLKRCDLTTENDLANAELIIFASPTYAHGELQAYFEQFLKRIQHIDLNQKNCAIIGLGDNKYDDDYTVESAVIIKKFVQDHNGKNLLEPLEIIKSPLPALNQKVKTWTEALAEKIK